MGGQTEDTDKQVHRCSYTAHDIGPTPNVGDAEACTRGTRRSGKEQCDDVWEAAAGEGKANQESLAGPARWQAHLPWYLCSPWLESCSWRVCLGVGAGFATGGVLARKLETCPCFSNLRRPLPCGLLLGLFLPCGGAVVWGCVRCGLFIEKPGQYLLTILVRTSKVEEQNSRGGRGRRRGEEARCFSSSSDWPPSSPEQARLLLCMHASCSCVPFSLTCQTSLPFFTSHRLFSL